MQSKKIDQWVPRLEKDGANAIRTPFQEIDPIDLHKLKSSYYIAQPKWDGWFTVLVVKNGKGTLFSRTRKYRENLDINNLPDNLYFGELIENTQWSYKFKDGIYHGKLILFDVLFEHLPYSDRLVYLQTLALQNKLPDWIEITPSFDLDAKALPQYFKDIVDLGFEGMVLVTKDDTKIKVKKRIEDDFIVMGFEESDSETAKRHGGMVRALLYGKDGKILGKTGSMPHQLKIDMYHHPEKYIGKVVTIRGKERFKSGALRHPAFVCIRDEADKKEV